MIKTQVNLQKTLQWSLLLDHDPDFDPMIFYDSKLHLLLFLYTSNFKVLPLTNKTLKIPSRIFYPPSFLYESFIQKYCHFKATEKEEKIEESKTDNVDLLFFNKGMQSYIFFLLK